MIRSAAEQAVQNSDDCAFVIDRELRLVDTNAGWDAFARANGGEVLLRQWPVGTLVTDAIPSVLRDYYVAAYTRVLATGERWEHEYECSSPTLERRFRMFVYPIEGQRLLVINAPIVERLHPGLAHARADEVYLDRGYISQCAHCRRVRNPVGADRWDWVPAYVANVLPNVSHGLCPPCIETYYPIDAE